MSKNVLVKIRKELKANIDQKYKEGSIRYFKEKIKVYGVRTPVLRKIANQYFESSIKGKNKKEIFNLCEEFLKSGYNEEATIAFAWAYQLKNEYQKSDFVVFERWLNKYVDNWGKCDDFCTHTFGELIFQYPELIVKVKKWVSSKNRWVRRGSAVIFILPIYKRNYLKDIFWIADKLLMDQDDLVQKGYGWMLKKASNIYQKEVFDFVVKRKDKMPRTALRYAIEKMPQSMRKKAMN